MQKTGKFSLALVAGLALSAISARADAGLSSTDLNISALLQVSDASGNPPTNPSTLLFDNRPRPDGSLTPVTAPDGHQVTWGEWAGVQGQGRAGVVCITQGSYVSIRISGLIPNGLYTVWIPIFKAPGFDAANFPVNVTAAGPLGAQDGTENSFVADQNGVGRIHGVLPPGMLDGPIPGPFDGCLTDEFEFHLHIAYHIDQMTHGHLPGPMYTWVLLGLFDFKPPQPAQPFLRNTQSTADLGLFRTFGDSTGAAPTDDGTLLFVRGGNCTNTSTPILAPDGHHVNFGEWNDVAGLAEVKCIPEGTAVSLHVSGLIPNGQYSSWVVVFKAPGFNPDPTLPNPPAANAITAGPLGLPDGSQNGFVADANGNGHILAILPPGPGTLINIVPFDSCLTDEVEFGVHIAYHIDGATHGPVQGPPCTWAVQRIWEFKP
jgi:hypothetical protein